MAATGLEVPLANDSLELDDTLDRAKAGDQGALSDLVDATSPGFLRSLSRRLCRDSYSARAVLQDAWMSAWQRMSEFESASHLCRWVYRVAVNRAISRLRHEGVERRASPGSGSRFLSSTAHADELPPEETMTSLVHRAVGQLPPRLRLVATMHFLHGRGVAEVAELLDVSGSAVKMRLHRARMRLRRSLEEVVSA